MRRRDLIAIWGALILQFGEGQCSACGGTKYLRHSFWHGTAPICRPCFFVWYESTDVTDPQELGAISLKLKAAGKYPWTGEFAP